MTWRPMAQAVWASSNATSASSAPGSCPSCIRDARSTTSSSPAPVPEREAFLERRFNTWRWRLLLNALLLAVRHGPDGSRQGVLRPCRRQPGQHVARRIRHAGSTCDPAENPYLHWIMKGTHGDALPMTWREEHYETIRARLDRLDIRPGSLEAFVSTGERRRLQPVGHLRIHVAGDVRNGLCQHPRRGQSGRAAGLLEHDGAAAGSAASRPRVRTLTDLEDRLKARDKAFFYSDFVIEEVRGEPGSRSRSRWFRRRCFWVSWRGRGWPVRWHRCRGAAQADACGNGSLCAEPAVALSRPLAGLRAGRRDAWR
jgi:hypothetical protein